MCLSVISQSGISPGAETLPVGKQKGGMEVKAMQTNQVREDQERVKRTGLWSVRPWMIKEVSL